MIASLLRVLDGLDVRMYFVVKSDMCVLRSMKQSSNMEQRCQLLVRREVSDVESSMIFCAEIW